MREEHGMARRAAFVVAAWTFAGLLLGAQAYVSETMRGRPVSFGRSFAIWLAFAYVWALITPFVFALAARAPFRRGRIVFALIAHSAGAVATVLLQLAIFAAVAPAVGATSFAGTWVATFQRLLGSAFILNLPVYFTVVAAAEMFRLARTARERESETLQLQASLAEARLDALRSQLHPHFLFNALNTVSVLMHEDADLADRVLGRLSRLLRRSLDANSANLIALREELEIVRSYLEIEAARFSDRLDYRIDADEALMEAYVPSFVLQPLVENAVIHGIAARARGGRIDVAAAMEGDRLRLTVRDDGPGIPAAPRTGVGLTNTRARLEQLYGSRHHFEVSAGAEGTFAIVLIPIEPGRVA